MSLPKNIVIYLIGILVIYPAQAQFHTIKDNDGYVNIRNEKNEITDRLSNNKAVYVFEPSDSNWYDIAYSKGGAISSGKAHKSRIKPLSDFEKIPIYKTGDNFVLLKKGNIQICVSEKPFIPKQHIFHYEEDFIQLIDHSIIWGTDGNIPKREYNNFQISIEGKEILLPDSAFQYLYEPTLEHTQAYYDKKTKSLYLSTMNGDGAGGYVVLWYFNNGIYEDRIVIHGF